MDVKQAVRVAKGYVLDLFRDEGVMDIGLEEVEEPRRILAHNYWIFSSMGQEYQHCS